ncbi:unnamed protein product [Zymoseptoria tritici ST99CH_1E4]|uniref:Uncharacterized protein n=1 Tax=Zymoseptoria tritici ST99CH_1E4 TaxID=1276532 RepID=A0A2H1GPV0_ZYMTR|nr:unnamed protein product [Zymoseptoria tritici ST99CH_1E4]
MLHESDARWEANDLANRITEMVGEQAWDEEEDRIDTLLNGMAINPCYTRNDVSEVVTGLALEYHNGERAWSRLQRPLERVGTVYWRDHARQLEADHKKAGLPWNPSSLPTFQPLSTQVNPAYCPTSKKCKYCGTSHSQHLGLKCPSGRFLKRMRVRLGRMLLGRQFDFVARPPVNCQTGAADCVDVVERILIRNHIDGRWRMFSTNHTAHELMRVMSLCKAQAASLVSLVAEYDSEQDRISQSRHTQAALIAESVHQDNGDDLILESVQYYLVFLDYLSRTSLLAAKFEQTLATLRYIQQTMATACSTLQWRLLYLQGQRGRLNPSPIDESSAE